MDSNCMTNFQTVLLFDEYLLHLMVQMDGALDGWWMATLFQQDWDVRKEVVEWWFGLEHWEVRW